MTVQTDWLEVQRSLVRGYDIVRLADELAGIRAACQSYRAIAVIEESARRLEALAALGMPVSQLAHDLSWRTWRKPCALWERLNDEAVTVLRQVAGITNPS